MAKSKSNNNVVSEEKDFSGLKPDDKIKKLKRRIAKIGGERCPDQADLANNTSFIFETCREIKIIEHMGG